MKLEDQVCSIELAKRLKELDVKQDALYSWIQRGDTPKDWSASFLQESERAMTKDYVSSGWCSAFTVAELGEMLPHHTPSMKDGQGYSCSTLCSEDGDATHWDSIENFDPETIFGGTEADARAKMLIYLIENKLVKP